jgi:hypothetical protein
MTATVTLADRRLPLPVADETQIRQIVEARATGNHAAEFRVRRPSPDGRKRVTVFRAGDVEAINVNGLDLTDLGSPVSTRAVAA